MADPTRPRDGLGSVADETARLLDALVGATLETRSPGAGTDGPPPAGGRAPNDGEAPEGGGASSEGERASEGGRAPERGRAPEGASSGGAATPHDHVCGSCGEAVGSPVAPTAEVCHLCPVCQLLRVVRQVRPETVDRLADLAAALTETLRDVAATRWAETAPSGGSAADRHRSQVEDIDLGSADAEDDGFDLDDVEDLQLDDDLDGDETEPAGTGPGRAGRGAGARRAAPNPEEETHP